MNSVDPLVVAFANGENLVKLHCSYIEEFTPDVCEELRNKKKDLRVFCFAREYSDGKFQFVYPPAKPEKVKKGKGKKGGKKKK